MAAVTATVPATAAPAATAATAATKKRKEKSQRLKDLEKATQRIKRVLVACAAYRLEGTRRYEESKNIPRVDGKLFQTFEEFKKGDKPKRAALPRLSSTATEEQKKKDKEEREARKAKAKEDAAVRRAEKRAQAEEEKKTHSTKLLISPTTVDTKAAYRLLRAKSMVYQFFVNLKNEGQFTNEADIEAKAKDPTTMWFKLYNLSLNSYPGLLDEPAGNRIIQIANEARVLEPNSILEYDGNKNDLLSIGIPDKVISKAQIIIANLFMFIADQITSNVLSGAKGSIRQEQMLALIRQFFNLFGIIYYEEIAKIMVEELPVELKSISAESAAATRKKLAAEKKDKEKKLRAALKKVKDGKELTEEEKELIQKQAEKDEAQEAIDKMLKERLNKDSQHSLNAAMANPMGDAPSITTVSITPAASITIVPQH